MVDAAAASSGARRLLERASDGPVARAVVSHPWEMTPLGPVEGWPDHLRMLVEVMLSSEFPMMLAWGPEYTQLYNDAFRPILGTGKHPDALGRSARQTWAEIWSEIGPLFSSVFEGEAVRNVDQRLIVNRNGYDEETFFTYSYSPVRDRDHTVTGLLVIATETTAQVIRQRRLSCIGSLARSLVSATSIESVAQTTVEALRDCEPVPAVEINLIVADSVLRIASRERTSTLATDRTLLRRVATEETPVVVDDDWTPGRPARRVAFGINDPTLQTAVVLALNPLRPFDAEYEQFVDLVRQTIAASMTAALLRANEIGALRGISDTLQHAMLELASDLPTVAARYLPKASNLIVGGDWYDVLDLGAGRRALIVGDCVGHGLQAATAMGALRSVSRALLGEGRGPAEVIDSLHRFATTMPAAEYATVVCAIVDLTAQTIIYSNAGHPPPLLVHGNESIWLDEARAAPLAVGNPTRAEAKVDARPGDLLVLYTDGLIERRGEVIDRGLDRLRDCVTRSVDDSVQSIADRLITDLADDNQHDDIALVVKRIH